jgi:ribonuclease R
MLPDRLSGDLCSLHEGVPRACIALRMRIDAGGHLIDHRFERGLMRSVATLHYQEVQDARDGAPNEKCAPLMDEVITPLYAAYERAGDGRGRPGSRSTSTCRKGGSSFPRTAASLSVAFRERLDAHRLIEEFMVLANVAAALTLEKKKRPLIYRVHEEPAPEKLDALREMAQASGLTLAKGQVLKTSHLNRLLSQAEGTDFDELINISTLRAMTQAYYSPVNLGHFGLALRSYAHFTSPIRRYSDLIVHRALISAHGWGDDGLSAEDIATLDPHRRPHLGNRAAVDDGGTRHDRPLPRRVPLRTHRHRDGGPHLGHPALRRLREAGRDGGGRPHPDPVARVASSSTSTATARR